MLLFTFGTPTKVILTDKVRLSRQGLENGLALELTRTCFLVMLFIVTSITQQKYIVGRFRER